MPIRRKMCRRYNDSGHAHALTFSCFHQRPYLARDRARKWFIDALHSALDKHCFHLWAYVIMPEHAHLVVWPTEHEYSISAFLASVKISVTRRASHYLETEAPQFLLKIGGDRQRQAFHFWQRGGGYDRNVTEPATIWSEIEYVHLNPVRRGLCTRPADWSWSSAADYLALRVGPVRIDRESLPQTPEG